MNASKMAMALPKTQSFLQSLLPIIPKLAVHIICFIDHFLRCAVIGLTIITSLEKSITNRNMFIARGDLDFHEISRFFKPHTSDLKYK